MRVLRVNDAVLTPGNAPVPRPLGRGDLRVGEYVGKLEPGRLVFGMNDGFPDGAVAEYCIAPFSQLNRADAILGQVPAGRFGNPAEIAKAVVFFASDESASPWEAN